MQMVTALPILMKVQVIPIAMVPQIIETQTPMAMEF